MNAHESHGPSYSNYIAVFVGLFTLTAATVGISYTGLGHGVKEFLAFAIATVKMVLVASIFMHLRFEPKTILYFAVSPLVLTAIFIMAIRPDVGTAG